MKSVKRAVHKHVHKSLKLRHHKHTGKILAHKHTSYRSLFLLMLAPIGMMALVQNLSASAIDVGVTAIVPVHIPNGKPTIDNPKNGATFTEGTVAVNGKCPITNPSVLVSIYEGSTLKGTTTCSGAGLYSLPVSFGYGTHTIFARVVTILNDIGRDSTSITISRVQPSTGPTHTPKIINNLPKLYPQILSNANFAVVQPIKPNGSGGGKVEWTFSIRGGDLPYIVSIDWGDGTVDHYDIPSNKERTYTHVYQSIGTYIIKVKVKDAKGRISEFSTIATTQVGANAPGLGLGLDGYIHQTNPFGDFVNKYIWQVYVAVLGALIFLWYLEHGHHKHHGHRHTPHKLAKR